MKLPKRKSKYSLQNLTAQMLEIGDQMSTDPEEFEQAGQEDCEEQIYTADGRPILNDSTSE